MSINMLYIFLCNKCHYYDYYNNVFFTNLNFCCPLVRWVDSWVDGHIKKVGAAQSFVTLTGNLKKIDLEIIQKFIQTLTRRYFKIIYFMPIKYIK